VLQDVCVIVDVNSVVVQQNFSLLFMNKVALC